MATLQSADAIILISNPKSFACKSYDVCVEGKSFSPRVASGSLPFAASGAELTLGYSVNFVKSV